NPDLLIDAATLTGAARVALGTALPAIFATRDSTWQAIEEACDECADPVWRLPFHSAYRNKLSSKVADLCNISSDAYGGAIIAALFLQEFVTSNTDWVHMDTMGYNIDARPGRPTGGEALGLLTLEAMIQARYNRSAPTPDVQKPAAPSRARPARPSAKKAGRARKKTK